MDLVSNTLMRSVQRVMSSGYSETTDLRQSSPASILVRNNMPSTVFIACEGLHVIVDTIRKL